MRSLPAAVAFSVRNLTWACNSSICFCASVAISELLCGRTIPQFGHVASVPDVCVIVSVIVADMSLSCVVLYHETR